MRKKLKVKDWHLCVYAKTDEAEHQEILGFMKDMNISETVMSQADENLTHENCGSTIANKAQRKILVLIGPQTSTAEMLNTIAHEMYHVVGIVCEDCAKEHGAWLSGEIMMRMADIIYPS